MPPWLHWWNDASYEGAMKGSLPSKQYVNKYTYTQIYKYTNTQIHKYTDGMTLLMRGLWRVHCPQNSMWTNTQMYSYVEWPFLWYERAKGAVLSKHQKTKFLRGTLPAPTKASKVVPTAHTCSTNYPQPCPPLTSRSQKEDWGSSWPAHA